MILFTPTEQPDNRPIGGGLYETRLPIRYEWQDKAARFRLVVPPGFVNDGASVPRLLWTLAGLTQDGEIRAAAILHDFIYHHKGDPAAMEGWFVGAFDQWVVCNKPITRPEGDTLFRLYALKFGLSPYRARLAWLGVRAAGWWAWKRNDAKRKLVKRIDADLAAASASE